jgi:hypothetical protein
MELREARVASVYRYLTFGFDPRTGVDKRRASGPISTHTLVAKPING